MDERGFRRVQAARAEFNKQEAVDYLEDLLDAYATLVQAASRGGELDRSRLSREGSYAFLFLTSYLNVLEEAADRGAERDFWIAGDDSVLGILVPELGGQSIDEITAGMIDGVGRVGWYQVSRDAIPAWRILRDRFGGETPLGVV